MNLSTSLLVASLLRPEASSDTLVLKGGTVIDVRDFGRSSADIRDAVVIIEGEKITSVSTAEKVKFPAGATVRDVSGKFILPGLIDGFAGLNSQAQANAYLYMGVTSIVGVGDRRRGKLYLDGSPSPRIFRLEVVGYRLKDSTESLQEVEGLARSGARVLLLYYPLTSERTRQIVEWALERGLVTIGELGFTRYPEAIEAGVHAFVHTSRYSLELAPAELRLRVAADPFGPPRTEYYQLLNRLDLDGASMGEYAKVLGAGRVGLIPTLSLEYLDLPGHENPWKEPAAAILDPKGIHLPADPTTGKRESSSSELFPPGFAETILEIEERYRRAGAKYLAGSGTSAFGTLPGISLHTELELMTRIGLTPRETLAAATANYGAIFGWREVGQLTPGANADLLILDENPALDIRNLKKIRSVVFAGKIVDRDALLARASERRSRR